MKYKYWFMNLKDGIGNRTKKELISYFDTARAIYELSTKELMDSYIVDEKQAKAISESKASWNLDEEYARFLRLYLSFITLEDEVYPFYLKMTSDPPYGMYFLGNPEVLSKRMVAMVGARRCSAYGRKVAEELAEALARNDYVVVSGMAKGIDTYSHCGALAGGGPTVAVLGCGVDVCYPSQNRELYHRIQGNGCVLSEYPPKREPLAAQFPSRNRIISGMSKQVIVVEAGRKSGSLITADFALEQGKDIYVVPGRITDTMSVGCNDLLSQGAAAITSYEGFLKEINENQFTDLRAESAYLPEEIVLEKEEGLVYSCFDFYPKSIESVLEECGLDLLKLLSVIMSLCDKGYLRECFKNCYVRCI